MGGQERMLARIDDEFRATAALTGRAAPDPRVRAALACVPRARFVPAECAALAERDTALPIGHGQTISQPYVVALMTDLLDLRPGGRVLEVGTGSGYQAAVLATLGADVYSVEIVGALARDAAARLAALGYDRVHVRSGDGHAGWPEHAPYDGVVVTAVAPDVPPALLAQLAPGGRLVMPLGQPYGPQQLTLAEKDAGGTVRRRAVLPVVFVPLTGEEPEAP